MDSMVSFAGKKVYMGIDVHKKNYSTTTICDGIVVKTASMRADAGSLGTYIDNFFRGAEVVCGYEAGFSGFVLQRELTSCGHSCVVVNPGSIEVAVRDRVKTDKRDSKKIAEHLSQRRVSGIRIPSIEQEERRLMSRSREQLVEERTRIGIEIKSKLYQFGLIACDDDRVMSGTYITEIENMKLSSALSFVLKQFCETWRHLAQQIKQFDEALSEQANADSVLERVYRSVPGVGKVSSRVLANELGDMSQFKNEDALFSFIGLTPTEYSSGDSTRKGRISRQGNPRVRHILVEVAWRAIEQDHALKEAYNRISSRAGGKKAIVAVARRIAGKIRACFRTSQLWKIGFGMEAQPAK